MAVLSYTDSTKLFSTTVTDKARVAASPVTFSASGLRSNKAISSGLYPFGLDRGKKCPAEPHTRLDGPRPCRNLHTLDQGADFGHDFARDGEALLGGAA